MRNTDSRQRDGLCELRHGSVGGRSGRSGAHGRPNPASIAADKVKEASKDAVQAFKMFASNPVGGLAGSYESLGARALSAGIVFGAVSSLCILLLYFRMMGDMMKLLNFMGYVKFVIAAVIPFVTLAAASFGVRMAFRGAGGLGSDCFIAGASLLPFAIVSLLGAIFGVKDSNVLTLLGLFATCIPVLMLFAGLTRICKLSERAATVAVPLMLLVSVWLTKTIYFKMLESALSGGGGGGMPNFGGGM